MAEESKRTLRHYEARAESFWDGTRAHDVSQNIDALLSEIARSPLPLGAPLDGDDKRAFQILDFGCGPGRDLVTFKLRGHKPTGLDGTARFVEMAHALSGCPVLHQDFLSLSLPPAMFDGVFCNASLFHIPSSELPRALATLRQTLVPGGVLFCSNPRPGPDGEVEGFQGERYCCLFDFARWSALISAAGFRLVHHYYRPTGLPCEAQPWLAMVWRATASATPE
jgi:SAM-dependent methyltransferase